jgi:hypothetical protein
VDWNDDGKLDLISGDTKGQVSLFINVGTRTEPKLAEGVRVEAGGKPIAGAQKTYKEVNGTYVVDKVTGGNHALADVYSKIHFADWDGDGLKDLLIGQSSDILLYKNVGTKAAPKFADPVALAIPGKDKPMRWGPYVYDWDADETQDLLVGTEDGKVIFYRNKGTKTNPELAEGKTLDLQGIPPEEKGYRWRIAVTDWNNDGKPDLLMGNFYSGKGQKAGGNVWLFLGK